MASTLVRRLHEFANVISCAKRSRSARNQKATDRPIGVYDRHEFHAEKMRAYEALAAQIDRIVNPKDNVVPLQSAGGRKS